MPAKTREPEMTFHERFGMISKAQLAAYKRHNVSQSDHDELVRIFGEMAYDTIAKVVVDPKYQLTEGSACFSIYKVLEAEREGDIG